VARVVAPRLVFHDVIVVCALDVMDGVKDENVAFVVGGVAVVVVAAHFESSR
jgi:hypothetical protein